jgi:hypothetical protein
VGLALSGIRVYISPVILVPLESMYPQTQI